jgi:2-dehydro-3-deoxyphosphooctonate aldolase (KDO 8-P synthase)
MADEIKKKFQKVGIEWIFKSCYDKDVRSSPDSFYGCGIEEGLKILSDVRDNFGIPAVSDFSDSTWASATGEVYDLVQVPVYLYHQSLILRAAVQTGRPILLKKASL